MTDSLASWQEEKQSAWAYRELAQCESDAKIAELFRALAAAADFQADKWLASSPGITPPAFHPSVRARITIGLARALGPRRVRHMLAAMKIRGLSAYDTNRSLAGHLMPTSVADVGARHKGYGGGNLRAAVFGVNDGLVSNASLIMGVAGAAAGADFVLTSGVAGLLAGRTLDGGGRVRLDALAARDVRVPDRPRTRRAARVSGRGSRGTRADLPGARHGPRGGAARQSRTGQERNACARCAGARGTRTQPRRPRLAVGRGHLRRSLHSPSARSFRWCRSCSACRCSVR